MCLNCCQNYHSMVCWLFFMSHSEHWKSFRRGSFLSSFCSDTSNIPVSVAAIPQGYLTLFSPSSEHSTVSMNLPSALNLLMQFVPQSATIMLFITSVQTPRGSFSTCSVPFLELLVSPFPLEPESPNLNRSFPDSSKTLTVLSNVSVMMILWCRSTVMWIGLDLSDPSWMVENDLRVTPSMSCVLTWPWLQSVTRYFPARFVVIPSGQSNMCVGQDSAVLPSGV